MKRRDGARQVWILKDGAPQPVEIKTGLTDGRMTEVLDGELKPGMLVIIDMDSPGT